MFSDARWKPCERILPWCFDPDDIHAATERAVHVQVNLITDEQSLGCRNFHSFKSLIEYYSMRLAPADFHRDHDGFESGTDTESLERVVKGRGVAEIGNHGHAVSRPGPFEHLDCFGPDLERFAQLGHVRF